MAIVNGPFYLDMVKELLKVFDLENVEDITSLSLHINVDDVTTLDITRLVKSEEIDKLVPVLEKYQFELISRKDGNND